MASKPLEYFNISKYCQPFLQDEQIRELSSQLTKSDLAWWTMVFLALKIVALFCLYIMYEKNKEKQMQLDKQKYELALAGQLEEDNEVTK